ncbi:hypothetical protein N7481_004768 [Penicillium waksmanii]|uniref:uncharacterized protein n=1 Tax=Penicillium waksmanii TaxID=69791 RepID=UPI0025471585|nr:uncharacterized protein N7481_004768 [Penicillium waksmanii]KAJ5989558.1 hypothetical protein N7481_004768 [Penicillium waksmanii]
MEETEVVEEGSYAGAAIMCATGKPVVWTVEQGPVQGFSLEGESTVAPTIRGPLGSCCPHWLSVRLAAPEAFRQGRTANLRKS